MQAGVAPWAAASAVLELAYIVLLAAAYRRADVSVIYPIARGAAPVLVLAAAIVTGVATGPLQLAGVLLVAGGIGIVAGGRDRAGGRDVLLALAVAASIAGYTLVDKHGLRYASPVPYLELVMVWPALAYAGWVASRDGAAALRAAAGRSALVAGVGMFAAYALVLAALQRGPCRIGLGGARVEHRGGAAAGRGAGVAAARPAHRAGCRGGGGRGGDGGAGMIRP